MVVFLSGPSKPGINMHLVNRNGYIFCVLGGDLRAFTDVVINGSLDKEPNTLT